MSHKKILKRIRKGLDRAKREDPKKYRRTERQLRKIARRLRA